MIWGTGRLIGFRFHQVNPHLDLESSQPGWCMASCCRNLQLELQRTFRLLRVCPQNDRNHWPRTEVPPGVVSGLPDLQACLSTWMLSCAPDSRLAEAGFLVPGRCIWLQLRKTLASNHWNVPYSTESYPFQGILEWTLEKLLQFCRKNLNSPLVSPWFCVAARRCISRLRRCKQMPNPVAWQPNFGTLLQRHICWHCCNVTKFQT